MPRCPQPLEITVMTNLVLFLACAPLWLLVMIGAGTFALVLLPLTSAGLPALADAFFHARSERRFIRLRLLQ